MQKTFFQQLLFLIFSIIILLFAVYFTNQIAFIQGFVFEKNQFFTKIIHLDLLRYVGNLIQAFFVVNLYVFACVSFGAFFVSGLIRNWGNAEKISIADWVAMVCTAFVAGHAVFSIFFVSLAAYEKFNLWFLIPIIVLGFFLGLPFSKKIISLFPSNQKINFWKLFNQDDYKLNSLLVIVIILLLLMYSTSRLSFDASAFYFSDEKITALTERLQFFQNNIFAASSFQTAISFAALIKLSGEQAARIYSWFNGLVIIIFCIAIAEKVGLSKNARLIVVILLLTSSAFVDLMGDGKIELISTAAVLAAIYWLMISRNQKSGTIYFFMGAFVGLAVASRIYNSFLVGAFVAISFVLELYASKGKGLLSLFKSLIWMGLGFLCLMLSHLFVNWLVLGDPFAFIKNLRTVESADRWHWSIPSEYIWLIRLLYPLNVTFINTPQSLGSISPLFLCGLIGIGLVRDKIKISRPLKEITIAAIVPLALWICTSYTVFEIRYMLFLWALLFMPVALVIEGFLSVNNVLLRRFAQSILLFLLLFATIRTVFISISTYSPMIDAGNTHCDIDVNCDALEVINHSAPVGSRILSLNVFKYYLRSDLFMCLSKHDEYFTLQNLSVNDKDAFWREVYRQGYQYIAYEKIYSSQHLRFAIIPNPNETPSWLHLEPIYGKPGENVVSYHLTALNPPVKVEVECVKNDLGIWNVQPLSATQK